MGEAHDCDPPLTYSVEPVGLEIIAQSWMDSDKLQALAISQSTPQASLGDQIPWSAWGVVVHGRGHF